MFGLHKIVIAFILIACVVYINLCAMKFKKSDKKRSEQKYQDVLNSDEDDDDTFVAQFQRCLVIDEKAKASKEYIQETDGNYTMLLQSLIKKYGKLKYDSRPEAQSVINLLRFEASSFFVKNIKNKRVLAEIIKSLKQYPDKAIKLYFYCLEYISKNLLNEEKMRSIELFLLENIKFHGIKFSLKYLSFWRNRKGLLELEIRMYGGGWHDIYDDVYDAPTPVPASWSPCTIL